MESKHQIGDMVNYIGSDDEWNHECCKGAEYEITQVYPPVWGIYYYNLKTTTENYKIFEHAHYPKLRSVREYQLEKT